MLHLDLKIIRRHQDLSWVKENRTTKVGKDEAQGSCDRYHVQ